MRETRRGRVYGGGGTPWDCCRLVILRAQASLVQLVLHVVGLRGGFDIHEGHSGTKPSGPVFLLEPRQQLDTLYSPIAEKRKEKKYAYAIRAQTRPCNISTVLLKNASLSTQGLGQLSLYSDRLDDQGSISGRDNRFSSTPHHPDQAQGPTQPLIQRVPRVKRPGSEADHSSPSSAEVNNGGAYTSTLPYVFIAWCLIN
jgi:hypothetical protein